MGYDAVLLLSFGGPERPEDVLPFLQNVTRGRRVPPERLAEVAEHYQHFGGVSPINDQCRALLAAMRAEFDRHQLDTPVYWGNRNWHPMLADTLAQARDDGVESAVAFVTSPYGSYSSCRQYLEDIAAARAAVGPRAPVVHKLRHYHDHPGLVEPFADGVRQALASLAPAPREATRLVFTAHSIPVEMAECAGPEGGRYEAQLAETAALVAAAAAPDLPYDLVWQSRSGPPQVPWLEPDINDHLGTLAEQGVGAVAVSPIGFISDHLEVMWDLDTEAADTAKQLGLEYARAATPGTDPRFVAMIRELVQERMVPEGDHPARRMGTLPVWDTCLSHCCQSRSAPRG
ncbi:ferrochelatase [Natronosporangium hydrolyticum]|uniref:Coproporphyrin III ferrochelatase n=1 Tax=Natronosporangium hydrolyticum TaxID=2811111 RepID=A0A895YA05_9ACTN|nr:ferrochelatase [Natronosporangium hydrolyticum]QSB13092.1 ferrochelatase [Natronosporangium hydrolyticum]